MNLILNVLEVILMVTIIAIQISIIISQKRNEKEQSDWKIYIMRDISKLRSELYQTLVSIKYIKIEMKDTISPTITNLRSSVKLCNSNYDDLNKAVVNFAQYNIKSHNDIIHDLQGLNNELQDKYKALIVRDAEIITYINSLSTAYDILRKKHNELSIIWASKFTEDKERKKEYKKQWDEKNKKKVNKKTTK